MRILVVSNSPKNRGGGVAGVIYNLGAQLEHRGHQVDYIFRDDMPKSSLVPQRFELVHYACQVAARILRSRRKYDLVNLHAPAGFVYGFLRKALRLKSVPPYVMTMHGLEERRVHAMSREAKKGRAWHFALKNRIWHRLYHQPAYKFSIRTADLAIILNREACSYVQLRYNCDSHRVWYVPNGVEEQFFLSRDYSDRVAPRLLFVGQWLDHKGIFYLRDAFEALALTLPDIQLTIAGCAVGPEQVKSLFRASFQDQITVIPRVERANMPGVYAQHDLFVFPSLVEGMPLVLLEAMAAGMPIVTTETCGMMDVIQDDINGILVPSADAQALVEAVLRLSGGAELRRRLGRAAQETARHYTWDRIARRVEKIFSLAAKNGKH